MIRMTQAIVAVMACTISAGLAGGVVGAAIGRFAPTFVEWLSAGGFGGGQVEPTEFGFGLGTVSGLFLGAGTGLFLVVALAFRDAWLARGGIAVGKPRAESVFD